MTNLVSKYMSSNQILKKRGGNDKSEEAVTAGLRAD